MRYYITTRQNTPLIHHIICTENIGMDPVVPCLFDDFFAAFLTKSGDRLVDISVLRHILAGMFDHADAAFGDCAGEDRVDLVSGEYERLFRHLLRRHRLGRLAADEGGPFDDILGALHEVGETLLFFLTLSKKWVKKRARPANTKD